MDIDGISGGNSRGYAKQAFGAAVVGKTLDYMNKNQHRHQTNNSYEFQKHGLMPLYTGKGTLTAELA